MKRLIIIVVMFAGLVGFVDVINEQNEYRKLYEDLLYPSVKITAGGVTGSGVVISHRRDAESIYILTAAHVVGDYSEVTVTFYSYRRPARRSAMAGGDAAAFGEPRLWREVAEKIEASVVITDTNKDLALLRVLSASAVKPAKLAPRDYKPYIFTPVWVVGCSLGLPPRPSFGYLSALGDSAVNYWEVSAPIVPGNSGGGVFLKDTHELIGIAVWVRTYREQLITTMAGIVPLQNIYEFLGEVDSIPQKGGEQR